MKTSVVMLVVIGFAGVSAMGAETAKKCEGGQGQCQYKAAIIKRFDKDGDGKLSDAEKAEMKATREARHQQMLKKWDKDGDGKLSDAEKAEMKAFREAQHQEMLKKWDKDGDGKLSDAERAEAKKARLEAKSDANAKPEGKTGKHDKNSKND